MLVREILSFILLVEVLQLSIVTLARDSCPYHNLDTEAEEARVCRAKVPRKVLKREATTCRAAKFPDYLPLIARMRPQTRPFRCTFQWTNRDKLKKKVQKHLKERFKVLLYFRTHMKGYNNHELNYLKYTGWITWVWVLKDYKYLLNYPHNFYALSLATTDIVIEEFEIEGKCDKKCSKKIGYKSCGLGRKDLVLFLQEIVTANDSSYEWEKVCLHANIGTSHLITPYSYTFLPDLLYYGYFIHALYFYDLTGFSKTKYFPNYYCYRYNDLDCESTPIWHRYNIILTFAIILWMYCPLLIYYFPSSNGGQKFDKDFYTSHATPCHFMKVIRTVLCYYPSLDVAIARRLRRLFLVLLLVPPTVRVLSLPLNCWIAFGVLCICLLLPSYLSCWIRPEHPIENFQPIPFLVKWPYPREMIQPIKGIEYQLLGNIMEERILLLTDIRFWCFIYEHSCGLIKGPQHCPMLIQWACYPFVVALKVIAFAMLTVVSIFYFFVPWLYFCKEMLYAVIRGEKSFYDENRNIFSLFMASFHGVALLLLFVLSMLCAFVYCFFIAEVTVYTLIGCVLTPDKAYKYMVLVGAFVGAIYLMVTQLQNNYSDILDEIIGSFNDKSRLKLLQKDLQNANNVSLNREDSVDSIEYSISITRNTNPLAPLELLSFDGIKTKVSKKLFHFTVEQCLPLRKKVFPIVVRMVIMLFYIIVVMQAKNVYHLEKNVGGIFGLAEAMAISFVPAVMTYLGTKNRFGKKQNVLLKDSIHKAIVDYAKNF